MLDFGAILAVGTPEEIQQDQPVLDAYLGRRRERDVSDVEERAAPVPMLELGGVRAAYGRIEVLHGVDLVVPRGLGGRAARPERRRQDHHAQGRAAARWRRPPGCVHIAGRHVNGVGPDALARIGVCTIPEGRGIFPNLTVRENLRMVTYAGVDQKRGRGAGLRAVPAARASAATSSPARCPAASSRCSPWPAAWPSTPTLLLLDELSMGLAPLIVEELYEIVGQIAESGVSILVVEQFARTVLGVADYAAIMLHGRVTSVGQPDDIAPELEAAYMGAG